MVKFRAWCPETKTMFPVLNWCFQGNQIITVQYRPAIKLQVRDVEIMQYTGLKDKNGVEIYEGDVLYWDGSIIGGVSFEHCEFIVGSGVNARAMCAMPEDLDIEVIGNIHENPELLEDTNHE